MNAATHTTTPAPTTTAPAATTGPETPGGGVPVEFAGTLTLTDDRPVIVRVFAAIAAVVGVVAAPVARVLEPVLLTAVWLVFPAAVLLVLAGHPGLIGLADHPHAVGWLTPLFAAGTVLAIAVVTDLIGDHRATTGRPARTQRRRFGARTPR